MSETKKSREQREVEEARRAVRENVGELRAALDRELKWIPRGEGWVLPIVGVACGLALALGRKKR